MKRFDFPLVSDVLFYGVACWFFTLGIMRYYRLPTAICITIATLISLALAISLYLLISRKHRRAALGKREREKKNALMLHLTLESAAPARIRRDAVRHRMQRTHAGSAVPARLFRTEILERKRHLRNVLANGDDP